MQVVQKKVRMTLVGVNGNAFAVMGAFQTNALRQGWSQDEVQQVLDEAMSDDYDHLLATIMDHCGSPDEDEE